MRLCYRLSGVKCTVAVISVIPSVFSCSSAACVTFSEQAAANEGEILTPWTRIAFILLLRRRCQPLHVVEAGDWISLPLLCSKKIDNSGGKGPGNSMLSSKHPVEFFKTLCRSRRTKAEAFLNIFDGHRRLEVGPMEGCNNASCKTICASLVVANLTRLELPR